MLPARAVLLAGLIALGAGCGATNKGPDDAPSDDAPAAGTDAALDGPAGPPGSPHLGAHVLAFHRTDTSTTPLRTAAIATRASGSTIVVSIGRGMIQATAAPTDNQGNAYAQLGTAHTYTNWTNSGTSLYAVAAAQGGAGHVLTAPTPADDEITVAAVEIVDGGDIQDFQWNEVLAGNPLTSRTVTTTGPATLVAFWWGDAGVLGDKTAVPSAGFVVTDSILVEGALVQCAAATRDVAEAGTYDVTWTSTPVQGAQLWLVAVQ